MLVFTKVPVGTDEEDLDAAIDNDSEVAEALRAIPTPDGLEVIPFSFNLLFEDSGDAESEIGRAVRDGRADHPRDSLLRLTGSNRPGRGRPGPIGDAGPWPTPS